MIGDRKVAVMAKIEKPAGVRRFDEILDVVDGIMVARGDLGVELPVQQVPPLQKRMVRKCRAVGKPVIVATQMLESMIESPMPTRAEVSDVATAIYEGADAVMLSAESAAGAHPVAAVQTMNAVATEVEDDPPHRRIRGRYPKAKRRRIRARISLEVTTRSEITGDELVSKLTPLPQPVVMVRLDCALYSFIMGLTSAIGSSSQTRRLATSCRLVMIPSRYRNTRTS